MVAALLIPLIAVALIAGLISFMLAVGLNAGTPLRTPAQVLAAESQDPPVPLTESPIAG